MKEVMAILYKILCAIFVFSCLSTVSTHADDAVRHRVWDTLLGAYVIEAEDGVNRFNYAALKANNRDVARLDTYLQSFATLDFDTLTVAEQLSAYINIYNALTVRHIIDRYPVKSIRSGYLTGPWKRVKTVIDGENVSLDHIEHGILRKNFSDPRIHYALNCASYGCPNLRSVAWAAATLDDDLDVAARIFINHSRAVAIRARGGLRVSSIYKWYRADFGSDEKAIIAHILDYANPDLAKKIRANADIRAYTYDWLLNDIP